ncbi:MAG: hypothetical protein WCK00_02765 [Deltaproteobacteria bacterium]
MSLPNVPITPIPNNNPDAVPSLWNTRYEEIDANFDNHEERVVANEGELAAARGSRETLADRIATIESITGTLEETSAVSVQRAVLLDWLYRDNRVAFELWAPGFTLIDAIDTPLVSGVSGDDSVDVIATAQLSVDEYYAIHDANGTILVKILDILSANRIRIDSDLPRNLGAGVLTRCTMDYADKSYADCVIGDIWLSKTLNIGTDQEGGAIVVRRSLNDAECRLYYMDVYAATWTEAIWSVRRQGGAIPEGFADYEYILPMRGDGCLKMVIEGAAVTIQHIVAVSASTGLGGFVNPVMWPDAPEISSPADAATGIFARPTLAVKSYSSPGGAVQAGIQFQLALADAFATVLHDSGTILTGLSYQVPDEVLAISTAYYLRARVADIAGLWSEWSAVTHFHTVASFSYVAAPSLVSPANDAIDVLERPTLQTGAFSVVGGADTHAASQWQVRAAAGTWAAPEYDSGEDSTNKLSLALPAGELLSGQEQYYIRARHKGTSKGWSEYSTEVHITTKAVFATVIGVCCTATGGGGGTWVHVDAAGATISTPATSVFNGHTVWGGMAAQTIDSQSMIKIPKFYCKRAVISGGANNGKEAWWISDVLLSGFAIHPAFRSGGADIDQIYIGKYQAHDDGTKLESHSATAPVVNISLTTSIAHAAARNAGGVTGFMLWSIYHWSAIQWLYLVENATMDSQSKTGAGRVTEASAANVDAADVAQATYRGLVGLWGNVYQWMDGLKTASGTAAISLWDRDGNKGWVSTGQIPPGLAAWSYPLTFMSANGAGYDFDDVFINATGRTSNSNATAPDGQYFSAVSEYFPYVGGAWGYAGDAGLWSVDCSLAAASTYAILSARLAKV